MLWVVFEVVLGMVAWAVVHLVSRLLSRKRQASTNRKQIEHVDRSTTTTAGAPRVVLPVRRRLTASERREREKKKEVREREKEKGKEREIDSGDEDNRYNNINTNNRMNPTNTPANREPTQYASPNDGGSSGVLRVRRPRQGHRYTKEVRQSDSRKEKEEKEKEREDHEEGAFGLLRYGVAALQGKRKTMEDRHCARMSESLMSHRNLLGDFSFFGVFDGHAGDEVSDFLGDHLHARVSERLMHTIEEAGGHRDWICTLSPEQRRHEREEIFRDVFTDIDEELRLRSKANLWCSGSTVVCVLIESLKSDDKSEAGEEDVCIHCANLGDSRCVLSLFSDRGTVIPLSEEHKPSKPAEKERIEAAGYTVVESRIDSVIAVSRALGDFGWKGGESTSKNRTPAISNQPESREVLLAHDAGFLLILACDGLWDVVSNEEAVTFVYDKLDICKHEGENISLHKISRELAEYAVQKGSTDNVTVLIVTMHL